jgi:tetratricopeptide (TPR) repeat protein
MRPKLYIATPPSFYRVAPFVLVTVAVALVPQPLESLLVQGAVLLALLLLAIARWERVVFDGEKVYRQGMLAFSEWLVTRHKLRIAISEIEMIATESLRSRRRIKQVKYIYRLAVASDGTQITIPFSSKLHSAEREIVKQILNAVDEHKLDPRSSELKQYLNDALSNASTPLITVAESVASQWQTTPPKQTLPTRMLRNLANGLKLEGYMSQASRCFRLAYQQEPRNPQLLYEMARFLTSLAMIEDPRLLNRARACLRLAARLAKNQPQLLERIGETYFERFDYKSAQRCFTQALAVQPGLYRANIGLAEIALRNGKLAHVAHFYHTAAQISDDLAQRNLAAREADYYGHLCSDEDYFEAELNRITKFRNFLWARHSASWMIIVFWLAAAIVTSFSEVWGEMAWFAVVSAILIWLVSAILAAYYGQRLEYQQPQFND